MNISATQSTQSIYDVYSRQSSQPTAQAAVGNDAKTDSVSISEEAKAMGTTYSKEVEALRLPDWYGDMYPDILRIDLMDHIGMPYTETNNYKLTQLPNGEQSSIREYGRTLLSFFHEEVNKMLDDGAASYVDIRDSAELKDAVLARFTSDSHATELMKWMQEIGQIS